MEYLDRSLEVSRLIKEIVGHIRRGMHKEFENAGLSGITPAQGMMIGILSTEGRMKVSEISRKMGLNNSTVSGIIDRLERQGIVERVRSEEDKRVVYISLAPDFAKVKSGMHPRIEEMIANRASPEDFDKIITGLNTLKNLLTDRTGDDQ